MSPQQDQLAKDIGAMSMEFMRKRIWTKNVQKDSLRYENAQKAYTWVLGEKKKKNLIEYSNQDESKILKLYNSPAL